MGFEFGVKGDYWAGVLTWSAKQHRATKAVMARTLNLNILLAEELANYDSLVLLAEYL